MTTAPNMLSLETAAVAKGLLAFVLLCLLLPIVAVVVASHGPREWIVQLDSASLWLRPALFAFAGAVTGARLKPRPS